MEGNYMLTLNNDPLLYSQSFLLQKCASFLYLVDSVSKNFKLFPSKMIYKIFNDILCKQ